MKRQRSSFKIRATSIFIGIVLCTAFAANGGEKEKEKTNIKILEKAERNIQATLQGDNDNLKESAIQVIRELQKAYPDYNFRRVNIPLMKILRNHDNRNFRVLAALALFEVGGETGQYAVKEAARFDDDRMVQYICKNLVSQNDSSSDISVAYGQGN